MRARIPAYAMVLLLSCMAACCCAADAGADQFLVTVLRSTDPVEVRELLGLQRPAAVTGPRGVQRSFRTSRPGLRRHSHWQVVVSEGQQALLATGAATPQVEVPWIEITRRGPVPHASLAWREEVHGIYVQARRLGHEVEVKLHQFSGGGGPDNPPGQPGSGLHATLRGRPGQWLDAGGNLLLDVVPPNAPPSYSVRHRDPRRFRLLVRLDPIE